MSVAAGILGGTALAGGVVGAIGSNAAANTQAGAANHAADLQFQQGRDALDFQKQVYGNQQSEIEPYLTTGYSGLANLANLLGISTAGKTVNLPSGNTVDLGASVNPALGNAGDLLKGYPGGPFTAPTGADALKDPGYQFGRDEGVNALTNSAAARGDLLSGNTARAITQFGNDYATTKYGDVYNRALQNYTTNYNTFQQQQGNLYNRLASAAGLGQTAISQLGNAGNAAAGNVANIDLTTGAQVGNNINNAGAARASGYTGIANSITGGINGISQLALLNSLLNGGGGQSAIATYPGAFGS